MVKMPSNFRSGNGAVTLAATRARTLHKTSVKSEAIQPDFKPFVGQLRVW